MAKIIELDNLSIRFGGLTAVESVSLAIEEGSISALIGPNGAGKSTIFNVITGIYQPTSGRVLFKEKDITGHKPYKITYYGIARTFQNIRLFKNLTVHDNVKIGVHTKSSAGLFGALTQTPGIKREEKDIAQKALAALELVGLAGKKEETAKNLSYGEQRRLEIARALASDPQVLLLDEPAAGMNPQEKQDLMEIVRQIRASGITIVVVEHDMGFVMNLSDYVYVLDYGKKIASGTPAQVQEDPVVIEAYLGKEVV